MSTIKFYREQAAQCRLDADAATLQNVRERNQRAADVWDGMAARLSRTLVQREVNEASKLRDSEAAARPDAV
jgi:hypothetical protein